MSLDVKIFQVYLIFVNLLIINNGQMNMSELDKLAVKNFRDYLRIPSVHPNINYDDCVEFIKNQAKLLGLPVNIVQVLPKKPVVIITWKGTEPEKPSIMLNGHMDVVPVFENEWKYPPFDAHMDEKGNIYARGSQDMKSFSIMYLEVIRRLKIRGIKLKRTIHVTFQPDEEVEPSGMKYFVKTQAFRNLNVGFAFDEARTSPNDEFSLFYGERTLLDIWVNCTGEAGHGSSLFDNTAAEKLRVVIDRFMDFRSSEKDKLKDPNVDPGSVTSVNLCMAKGGVQVNVLPSELSVAFDIRVSPTRNFTEFIQMIEKWLKEAGEGVHYSMISDEKPVKATKLDNNNIYWLAFQKAANKIGIKYVPRISQGATDIRFLRALGIPALGFSAFNNTPTLPHASNEYLNKEVFLRGIEIYIEILTAVANT